MQTVFVYRVNGEKEFQLEGDGPTVRDEAIKTCQRGVDFEPPSTKLLAMNVPDGGLPSASKLLDMARDAEVAIKGKQFNRARELLQDIIYISERYVEDGL